MILFIWIMFISFAPPKEMNQRKGGRKRQLLLFFAICTKPFPAPKNMEQFAPFPVCPRAKRIIRILPLSFWSGELIFGQESLSFIL
jgi:hypothetical protein